MADFQKPTAGWLDGWDEANGKVTLGLGQFATIWLRGGGPNNEKLSVELTPQNPKILKIIPNPQCSIPNVQEFDIEGLVVGAAQLDAFLVRGKAKVPYSKPLQIEITAKLAAYSGQGITVRLNSSTLGAITNLSIWERQFFSIGPDAEETVHSVWDLAPKAEMIFQRSKKPFRRLDIVAHGSEDSLEIGSDTVSGGNMVSYALAFNLLEQYFQEGSFVRILGCSCGGNAEFLHRLAGMMGVTVWGGIGDMDTGWKSDSGKYASCDPNGKYVVMSKLREY
jgi:hypothetical protein